MREFVRYDLARVTARLERFDPGAIRGARTTYILYDQSLVSEEAVHRDASLMMKILSRHRQMRKVALPFAARLITIKSHARVFDFALAPGVTAKVQLRERRDASFSRDVTARRLLAPHLMEGEIGVPTLRERNPKQGWIMEDFVPGGPAHGGDLDHLMSSARRMYEPFVGARPIVRSPQTFWLLRQLKDILRELAPSLANVPERGRWLCGLCHRDLGVHNLLKGENGRLWVLDWEKAAVVPLIEDFGKLYLSYPRLKDALLELLEALGRGHDVIPPIDQLALGAAFALRWREFNRAMVVAERLATERVSRSVAMADYDRATARSRQVVADLAL